MIGICTSGKETKRDEKCLLQVVRLASSMGRPDVAEVYPPPRVAALAERFGLMPGLSLDLSVLPRRWVAMGVKFQGEEEEGDPIGQSSGTRIID